MPPKPATQAKLPTKTSTKPAVKSKIPSKSDTKSIPNPQNPSKSDLSDSNELKISNRAAPAFDLNEPWSVQSEEVEESSKIEIKNESRVSEVGNKGNEETQEAPIKEEKKKQKEYEVFVGGLDRDAVEEDLHKVFCKVGEIVEVRLVKSRFSQKNKGFAFVRFATVEQAKKAAYELNYTQIRGKICEVTRNNDNETLHVGNICTSWTKDMLLEKLRPFELENLEEVLLIEDPSDKRRNRGYAFLNFGTHMDAAAACHRLQKGNVYFGTSLRADIAFAKSAVEPDEEIMAQVKSVFLDRLPPSWDEEQVHEHFKFFGKIDSIELARNMPSAKRKDFGFISFRTREAALSCIDAVNKYGIGEGARKVLLKASLRKPLQRRMPSTMGSGRGYSSNTYDDWSSRSRGIDRSYSNRPSRTVESFGRGRGRVSNRGFSDYNRYSTRGGVFKEDSSPAEKYGSQYRRGSFRQGLVAETARSGSRDPYPESSSYRHSLRSYEDFPASHSRVNSRGQFEEDVYDHDIYDPEYEYYESFSLDAYDYPAPSGLKRSYSALDDDQLVSRPLARRGRSGEYGLDNDDQLVSRPLARRARSGEYDLDNDDQLVSRSLTRRARTGEYGLDNDDQLVSRSLTRRARTGEYGLEMDVYPGQGISSYEEYSRNPPDDYYDYDSKVYASRYLPGTGASRSYHH